MRILIFTGKGGVGKTTVSAATAVRCAEQGARTLVISTDPAHSLGDAFDSKLGNDPLELRKNLWAQEINVLEQLSTNWSVIKSYLASVIRSMGGLDDLVSEEMAVPPGMEEVFGLLEIYKAKHEGKYDCMVIDCAPTAQTLRLLSLPDVATWWIEKILPMERRIAATIRPMKRSVLGVPIPSNQFYNTVEVLFNQIKELKAILTDSGQTSVRLVLNPERVVIEETQRAHTYLNLYGYPTDCVVVNKILPRQKGNAYFRDWVKMQTEYLQKIEHNFVPLPILKASYQRGEIIGIDMLSELAAGIYGDRPPLEIFYNDVPQQMYKRDGEYVFTLSLPFASKDDLEIFKDEDQLIIRAGHYKREMFLPRSLTLADVKKASFEDNKLSITFTKQE